MENETVLRMILDGQNAISTKLDGVENRLMTRMDSHSESDTREFKSIRDEMGHGLGGLRDRVTRVETVADTVDSLTDTAMDHEHRIVIVESDNKSRRVVTTWARWFVTGLIAAASALGAWLVKH
jgi:hypothetical protein